MSSIDVWDASVRGDLQEVLEYLQAGCDPNGEPSLKHDQHVDALHSAEANNMHKQQCNTLSFWYLQLLCGEGTQIAP
jgi:hypothetical protein